VTFLFYVILPLYVGQTHIIISYLVMRFLSYIISNPIVWLQYVTYQVIKPLDNWEDISDRLEACLFDIKSWMCMTILQLNQDKIELIIFAPKHKVKSLTKLQFNFDGAILSESSCVRNLGGFFRPNPQYGATCLCNYQILFSSVSEHRKDSILYNGGRLQNFSMLSCNVPNGLW
jgi:hypothetical protein